ncbi:MAG: hypothetical protein MPJ25_00255 [Pirellulales bacterium]|nr:hypothetical protein [Pirellulales bacterium]
MMSFMEQNRDDMDHTERAAIAEKYAGMITDEHLHAALDAVGENNPELRNRILKAAIHDPDQPGLGPVMRTLGYMALYMVWVSEAAETLSKQATRLDTGNRDLTLDIADQTPDQVPDPDNGPQFGGGPD